MRSIVLTIFSFYISVFFLNIHCANYPSDLPKCKPGDGQCIPKAINKIVQLSAKGNPSVNLIPLDPLYLEKFDIFQGDDSPVNIKLNLKDLTFTGLSHLNFTASNGWEKDPTNSKFELESHIDLLTTVGKYDISGQILVLPITGTGFTNITLENMGFNFKFVTSIETRKNEDYLHVDKIKMSIILGSKGRLRMYFENLFNDKSLSETMNIFLNENYKLIFNELEKSLSTGYAEVVKEIVNPIFKKIPYRKLFIEE